MGKLLYLNVKKAPGKQRLKYIEWIGLNDYRLGLNNGDLGVNHMDPTHKAWFAGYKRGPRDKQTKLQITNIFRST